MFKPFLFSLLFVLSSLAKADGLYWLDVLLDKSDIVVTGEVVKTKLIKRSDSPLVSIEYELIIESSMARQEDFSCVDKIQDSGRLVFEVNVHESLVPTGANGMFFLNIDKECTFTGVSGRYSLFRMKVKGEVTENGYPLKRTKLFKFINFDNRIQLSDEQQSDLIETIAILSNRDIGSVDQVKVIKADVFLAYVKRYWRKVKSTLN